MLKKTLRVDGKEVFFFNFIFGWLARQSKVENESLENMQFVFWSLKGESLLWRLGKHPGFLRKLSFFVIHFVCYKWLFMILHILNWTNKTPFVHRPCQFKLYLLLCFGTVIEHLNLQNIWYLYRKIFNWIDFFLGSSFFVGGRGG